MHNVYYLKRLFFTSTSFTMYLKIMLNSKIILFSEIDVILKLVFNIYNYKSPKMK